MLKTLPITKARDELTDLVDKASKRLDEYTITVNGVPKATLVSAQEYESWKETLDILSNPKLLKSIKLGEKEIKEGKYVTLEKLKEALD